MGSKRDEWRPLPSYFDAQHTSAHINYGSEAYKVTKFRRAAASWTTPYPKFILDMFNEIAAAVPDSICNIVCMSQITMPLIILSIYTGSPAYFILIMMISNTMTYKRMWVRLISLLFVAGFVYGNAHATVRLTVSHWLMDYLIGTKGLAPIKANELNYKIIENVMFSSLIIGVLFVTFFFRKIMAKDEESGNSRLRTRFIVTYTMSVVFLAFNFITAVLIDRPEKKSLYPDPLSRFEDVLLHCDRIQKEGKEFIALMKKSDSHDAAERINDELQQMAVKDVVCSVGKVEKMYYPREFQESQWAPLNKNIAKNANKLSDYGYFMSFGVGGIIYVIIALNALMAGLPLFLISLLFIPRQTQRELAIEREDLLFSGYATGSDMRSTPWH